MCEVGTLALNNLLNNFKTNTYRGALFRVIGMKDHGEVKITKDSKNKLLRNIYYSIYNIGTILSNANFSQMERNVNYNTVTVKFS